MILTNILLRERSTVWLPPVQSLLNIGSWLRENLTKHELRKKERNMCISCWLLPQTGCLRKLSDILSEEANIWWQLLISCVFHELLMLRLALDVCLLFESTSLIAGIHHPPTQTHTPICVLNPYWGPSIHFQPFHGLTVTERTKPWPKPRSQFIPKHKLKENSRPKNIPYPTQTHTHSDIQDFSP